uniref:Uncharacterized protein n=1 Tax=Oryza sativa subsp. japonica TaxID=39947 RepID=Q6H5A3_ORYSJ|nr:hypothetical protein [Oryza sativa Japonica Group]
MDDLYADATEFLARLREATTGGREGGCGQRVGEESRRAGTEAAAGGDGGSCGRGAEAGGERAQRPRRVAGEELSTGSRRWQQIERRCHGSRRGDAGSRRRRQIERRRGRIEAWRQQIERQWGRIEAWQGAMPGCGLGQANVNILLARG